MEPHASPFDATGGPFRNASNGHSGKPRVPPDVVREKQKKLPRIIDAIDASSPSHVAQGIRAVSPRVGYVGSSGVCVIYSKK